MNNIQKDKQFLSERETGREKKFEIVNEEYVKTNTKERQINIRKHYVQLYNKFETFNLHDFLANNMYNN